MKNFLMMLMATMFISGTAMSSTLMDSEWAEELCDEWNDSEILTEQLKVWAQNDLDRGYKVMLMRRSDCNANPVQLTLELEDGLVVCTYGGTQINQPNYSADYQMSATTYNWGRMGRGVIGPKRAMISRALRFNGPKWEAMKNMAPFGSFLRLMGFGGDEVDRVSCPTL